MSSREVVISGRATRMKALARVKKAAVLVSSTRPARVETPCSSVNLRFSSEVASHTVKNTRASLTPPGKRVN